MVTVNNDGRKYGGWIEYDIRLQEKHYRFWPYAEGSAARKTLKKAMDLIKARSVGASRCDGYFNHLPENRSFTKLWKDPDFVIHWDPRSTITWEDTNHAIHKYDFFGITSQRYPKNITISNWCLDQGPQVTAATIVHEMAHVNGAPQTDSSAEDSLPPCGFSKLYQKGLIG